MRRLFALIRNKYLIAGTAFLIWMAFFDHYDLGTQFSYQQERKKLEREKEFYEREIKKVEKSLRDVRDDPAEISRIARERYKMKKDNEDVYILDSSR